MAGMNRRQEMKTLFILFILLLSSGKLAIMVSAGAICEALDSGCRSGCDRTYFGGACINRCTELHGDCIAACDEDNDRCDDTSQQPDEDILPPCLRLKVEGCNGSDGTSNLNGVYTFYPGAECGKPNTPFSVYRSVEPTSTDDQGTDKYNFIFRQPWEDCSFCSPRYWVMNDDSRKCGNTITVTSYWDESRFEANNQPYDGTSDTIECWVSKDSETTEKPLTVTCLDGQESSDNSGTSDNQEDTSSSDNQEDASSTSGAPQHLELYKMSVFVCWVAFQSMLK